MAIRYILLKSTIPSQPNGYRAQVMSGDKVDQDNLIADMILHDCPADEATIQRVLENYYQAIERFVLDGRYVITPHARYRASIRGVFDGPTDGYDPGRHKLVAAVNAGHLLRRTVHASAQPVKEETVLPAPNPLQYEDLRTGERNGHVTPGGPGTLLGYRLRYDPADVGQGVFFLASDGSATRVEEVIKNDPSELIFTVPALAAGTYEIEVRAIAYNSSEIRTGVLHEQLTIA